jgi:hypothetical protein
MYVGDESDSIHNLSVSERERKRDVGREERSCRTSSQPSLQTSI